MELIKNILTNSGCYLAGYQIKPKGLMFHSVGCPQPRASVFLRTWNRTGQNVCPHAMIDGLDGKVYQTLPWNWRGWHAGGAANNTHIGVETGEPDCITYTGGDRFTCSNLARAREIATRSYNSAVELFAYLCKEFNFNPLEPGVIISHNEGGKSGVASRHSDPEHLWEQLGMSYTMDGFRKDVKKAMEGNKPEKPENELIYRVQVGAFHNKEYAEDYAKSLKETLKKAGVNDFDAFVVVKGDVDGDGKITSADAREALKMSVGLE